MKKAFGIFYAIVILLLISSVGIFVLENVARDIKLASDEHIKTQLNFYINSSIEYALLWMSENKNRSSGANYKDLEFLYDKFYKIDLRIYHIKDFLPKESKGSVIIDIKARYDNGANETIVVTKRVSVKP